MCKMFHFLHICSITLFSCFNFACSHSSVFERLLLFVFAAICRIFCFYQGENQRTILHRLFQRILQIVSVSLEERRGMAYLISFFPLVSVTACRVDSHVIISSLYDLCLMIVFLLI